ncbi:hypothetical protein KDA_74550 [Dictyobacter alpinus]|uniref:Uncharacterized protein n=1 Tax=Dictyobacter alpinus TaxID=2014873 RepID=A0A402BKV9_9CHLR|nr:hypothetical protein KDA_74550 [Dictyobacter alpinus]
MFSRDIWRLCCLFGVFVTMSKPPDGIRNACPGDFFLGQAQIKQNISFFEAWVSKYGGARGAEDRRCIIATSCKAFQ